MPLTELLSIFKGEMDATQQRASTSTDPASRPGTDFCELIWENGQIMMQGQSAKPKRGPGGNDFQSRDCNNLRMSKFGSMDSMLGDYPLSVPSCQMGLDQDVEMVPWLGYGVEDHLHNDYACDFLPELSGVTMNDISTENHLGFRDKRSGGGGHGNGHDNSGGLKHGGDIGAAGLSTEKYTRGGGGEVPQFTMPAQHTIPRSGVSDVTGDVVSNAHQVASRDSNPSSLCAFGSLRMQKMDAVQPSTSSGLTNFPYFSRPTALVRASHLKINPSKRVGNDEQRCAVTSSTPADSKLVNLASGSSQKEIVARDQSAALAPVNENSVTLPKRPAEELPSGKKLQHKEDVAKNDDHGNDASMSKVGDRNVEPVGVTSSVCSGNSVDRTSNERPYGLKRKSRETGDSEGPSEEIEEESVGAKKGPHARTSSKRSRAAEVHNLSERRRRDRINEKMRALQELIPNCNKVDKASMLDEAIEYLKTLQLQVQMLSMGAGMYMHPMMLPPGMQPIHGAHMPHFSPMGLGMGMGIGFGMNMLDVNGGMKMLPIQGAHYPVPGAGAPYHGMPGSSLQPFGHPVQGLQMPMQRATVHPMQGAPPLNVTMGLNVPGVAGSTDASHLAPTNIPKDANLQASREGVQQSAAEASETAVAATGTNTVAR